ncbi:Uu.00g087470.m01.CDS01 [Anthostomella pinea]|uniref:Uu.00g087470.m01.CDS01 n=1 Tax=Anthostomella pinea TaxID=933095 RepID=A0AAI8YJV8_9PEZI|nr:Uu.00g087470.m01.CDS01 [Anthostomella pinea]
MPKLASAYIQARNPGPNSNANPSPNSWSKAATSILSTLIHNIARSTPAGISPSSYGDDVSTSTTTLSTGAMIGIAIASAVVLFTGLAFALIRLAQWQDRRHAATTATTAATTEIPVSSVVPATTSTTAAAAYADEERPLAHAHGQQGRDSESGLIGGGGSDGRAGGGSDGRAGGGRSGGGAGGGPGVVEDDQGHRRLRKKSVAIEHNAFDTTTGTVLQAVGSTSTSTNHGHGSGQGHGYGHDHDQNTHLQERERERERDSAKHTSLPVLPPVLSRLGSFNLSDSFASANHGLVSRSGLGSGSGSASNNARTSTEQQRSPDKQRCHLLAENRRKTSWIDEDALHGPRVSSSSSSSASPHKRRSRRRKPSLGLGMGMGVGGIRRSLSRRLSLRSRGGTSELLAGSPTLPCTETGRGRGFEQLGIDLFDFEFHEDGGAAVVGRTPATRPSYDGGRRAHSYQGEIVEMVMSPQPQPRPPLHQYQIPAGSLSVSTGSPRKAYNFTGEADGQNVSPTRVVQGVHQRNNSIALDAAQQLAGVARVPQPVGQRQQRPRFKQSNTDAELQAILRRTTERLQDGGRRGRSQTMMLPATSASFGNLMGDERLRDAEGAAKGNAMDNGGRDITPSRSKSQKSASVAVPACSELEGCSPQRHMRTDPHIPLRTSSGKKSRHVRDVSHASAVSMLSEPDSFVAPKRVSQPEGVNTALSSPSRARPSPAQPLQQQQQRPSALAAAPARPYSTGSSDSSALSTLYSEEEASMQSPPVNDPKLDATPKPTDMHRRSRTWAISVYDVFAEPASHQIMMQNTKAYELSPTPPGASPSPLRVRKGTMGQMTLSHAIPRPQPRQGRNDGGNLHRPLPPKTTLSFNIHAMDATADDAFTPSPSPPPIPPRHSRILHPLPPVELPAEEIIRPKSSPAHTSSSPGNPYPIVRVTKASPGSTADSPTPTRKNKRQTVIPPPQTLRAMVSSPTLGAAQQPRQRGPSPVASDTGSGLSSLYDSYEYNSNEDGRSSRSESVYHSTATLVTVPTAEEAPAKGGEEVEEQESGRSSRYEFRTSAAGVTHAETTSTVVLAAAPDLQQRPRSMPETHHRVNISIASVSSSASDESSYSQDVDTVGQLRTDGTKNMGTSTNTGNVTTTVAELRRMNSQISSVSGYSTAANTPELGNMPSPTLPAMRGVGCSPGRRSGGGKMYLALGSPGGAGGDVEGSAERRAKGRSVGGELKGNAVVMSNSAEQSSAGGGSPIRRGVMRRSRRGTVGPRFEEDLDKAREVLKERSAGNVDASKNGFGRDAGGPPVTHASKLIQEEGRAGLESLGLYDEKGFLMNSPHTQPELLSPVPRRS